MGRVETSVKTGEPGAVSFRNTAEQNTAGGSEQRHGAVSVTTVKSCLTKPYPQGYITSLHMQAHISPPPPTHFSTLCRSLLVCSPIWTTPPHSYSF